MKTPIILMELYCEIIFPCYIQVLSIKAFLHLGSTTYGFLSYGFYCEITILKNLGFTSNSPFLMTLPFIFSGKTSLLLQFAYNCAKETSASVVFICRRHSLERNPPFLPQVRQLRSLGFLNFL